MKNQRKRKSIQERLRGARDRVVCEIANNASRDGLYAGGLASEGYAGGYRDALEDVQLLLDGVTPDRRGYWTSPGPVEVQSKEA